MRSEYSDNHLQQMIKRFHFEVVSGDMLAADAVLCHMIHMLNRLDIPSEKASAVRGSLKQLMLQTDKNTRDYLHHRCTALLHMPLVDRRYLN